jgi:hypothetical protein
MLSPEKQTIKGEILTKINKEFGSYKEFKKKFEEESIGRFGSGWAWLVLTKNNRLKIMTTPNQDNPQMNDINGGYPLLGLDLWEHAYYLKYQSKRDEYIKRFWDVVNWEFVDELYQLKKKKEKITEQVTFKLKDFLNILEQQQSLFPEEETNLDYLNSFCLKKSQRKGISDPFCKLLKLRKQLRNNELEQSLNNSFETLVKFYNFKRTTSLQKVIDISLSDENYGRTISFLKILTDFIINDIFEKHEIKKRLSQLETTDISKDDLSDLLSAVRELEYAKYEKSFEGDEFDIKQTKLSLPLSCNPKEFYTLFELLTLFKSGEKNFDEYVNKMKNCIGKALSSDVPPIKADLITKKPLYVIDENNNKELVFNQDTHFEVKKMDVEVDSYLSEFFSIFKQSNLKSIKKDYLDEYNKVISVIYNYVKENGNYYLEKIKSQINGIIFDNNLIVPIENLHFYWSNKGQRGCDELRLSIRFRIKPDENNQINTYIYTKGSDILVQNPRMVSDSFFRKYKDEIKCP